MVERLGLFAVPSLRAEENQLHCHAALAGLRHEILQPAKVSRVPFGEIELVSAIRRAPCFAARPWTEVTAFGRRECVASDVKRTRYFAVGAGKHAREIEPI